MKRINASVMTVAVVLALIAFVAPSSAYSIDNGRVACSDWTTTWEFEVRWDTGEQDISNIIVAWCNRDAVKGVLVGNMDLTDRFDAGYDPGWDYVTKYEITGIKIDYPVLEGEMVEVKITLDGCYGDAVGVAYGIKAADLDIITGTVDGPFAGGACTNPIPEFSTIAIPIASILGLLFFFNHRKRREE